MLKVRHAIFNPLTYVTASFVHDDLQHLGSNLLGFILFTFLLYYISRRVSKQKFFFYSLLMVFVVLPLLNYGLLYYFRIWKSIEFGYGLSLVGSGSIGLTVPTLTLFFQGRLKEFSSIFFFISFFLFTFCFIIPSIETSLLYLLLLVLCGISGLMLGKSEFAEILRFASSSGQKEKLMELFIVIFTLGFYFFSVVCLFPADIVSQGGIIDIVSHYIGLLLGIVLPFLFHTIYVSMRQHVRSLI